MTLKNSARNCPLKLYEIVLIDGFLKTEKSKFVVPGPFTRCRPALPRRLKQASGGSQAGGLFGPLATTGLPGFSGSKPYPRLGGAGSQLAFQNAKLGAVGTLKHWVST